MALNNDYPILNGIAPSFADVALKITPDGGPILDTKDFSALSDGRSVEVGEQRGASGGRVMRRTSGSISYEGSITFYRSGYQKLYRELARFAPLRGNQRVLRFVHFGVQIQHTPIGDGFDLAEGTDADQIEVPVSIAEIVDIIDGEEIVLL